MLAKFVKRMTEEQIAMGERSQGEIFLSVQ